MRRAQNAQQYGGGASPNCTSGHGQYQNNNGTNNHDQYLNNRVSNEPGQYHGDSQFFAEENEGMTSQLKDKVKTLKSMTIQIGDEIRSQNKFLDEMDTTFGRSGNFLEQTMRRLGVISKGSQKYHLLILFLFCFFVFLLLWMVLKFR